MRWYEKLIPEKDESVEIYGLEDEGETLVKYAGWREIEPDEVAKAIDDSNFVPENNPEWEKAIATFCNDMSGYVEAFCDNVGMQIRDTEYVAAYEFYADVAEELRRILEQNDLIEQVWQPVRKGE